MLIAGLTGNIGSGKTAAAEIFAELGAEIIDVDKLGHSLFGPTGLISRRLTALFGKRILDGRQNINRKVLGEIVFSGPKKLKQLNAVIHPALIGKVKKEISRIKKRKKKGIVIVDGALLIEMRPVREALDCLIVVKIKETVQIERLRKRQSLLSKAQILQRIKSQGRPEEKEKAAHYIIDNSGTRGQTRKQIKVIWGKLKNNE